MRLQVIDPALFDQPVSVPHWLSVQRHPDATHVFTDEAVFDRAPPERDVEFDPTFAKTRHVLAHYRLQLRKYSRRHGPPPYAQCLA